MIKISQNLLVLPILIKSLIDDTGGHGSNMIFGLFLFLSFFELSSSSSENIFRLAIIGFIL